MLLSHGGAGAARLQRSSKVAVMWGQTDEANILLLPAGGTSSLHNFCAISFMYIKTYSVTSAKNIIVRKGFFFSFKPQFMRQK